MSYDPAYVYEIGHILRAGLERMYGQDQDDPEIDPNVMYYITMYNEPMRQPKEPENLDVDGLLKGMYKLADGPATDGPKVQLLASGVAVAWAYEAQQLLADDWGVSADIWSVTSWSELRRDGLAADEARLLDPASEPRVPHVTKALEGTEGPVVAASDYMRAVQDQIRQYVPNHYTSVGADGYAISDTRPAARRHFLIDGPSIAVQALISLADTGKIDIEKAAEAARKYKLDDPTAGSSGSLEGGAA